MLTIDGSAGEGGGQILRTALALSMITGVPFRIDKIRAGRNKPGLLRQHLTCVQAAERISSAKTTGVHLGSTQLAFDPGPIRAGSYNFAIGTAGSTTLVFQTIFPALLHADGPSRVTLCGGTHNPSAPTFDYLERAFRPQLAKMGARLDLQLERRGYFPAGAGQWHATVYPEPKLAPLTIDDTGPLVARRIIADVANLPFEVAEREVATSVRLMSWPPEVALARTVEAEGHGNALQIELQYANVTEIATSIGARNISAEKVAESAVADIRDYLAAHAPVGLHLADQLLLPMALAGGGAFITGRPTSHTITNIAVIEKFLPVEFVIEQSAPTAWRIQVS